MREKWEKEWKDRIIYENDANDFFYEWYELESQGRDLTHLFKDWLLIDGSDAPVVVKVRRGAIFISLDRP